GGAGQHDHCGVTIDRPNLLEQLDAGHHRHLEIGDDELGTLVFEQGDAGAAVLGEMAAVAGRQEDLMKHFSDLAIVVDDQDVPRCGSHAMRPLPPTPMRRPPGSSPPSWRRTALRRLRGTNPPRWSPRRPAGSPRRSWR